MIMVDMKLTKGKFSIISYIAAVSFLLIFAYISIFGMSLSMQMRDNGTMESCPLMGNTAILCSMTVSDHAGIWQRMFSAMPVGKVLTVLVALLFASVFALFLSDLAKRRDSFAVLYQFYRQEHPDSKLFNFLNIFFARGTLQPIIYA